MNQRLLEHSSRLTVAIGGAAILGLIENYLISEAFRQSQWIMLITVILAALIVGAVAGTIRERMGIPMLVAIPPVFMLFGYAGMLGFRDSDLGWLIPSILNSIVSVPSTLIGTAIGRKLRTSIAPVKNA